MADQHKSRRRFIQAAVATGIISTAGCQGDGDGDTPTDAPDDSTPVPTTAGSMGTPEPADMDPEQWREHAAEQAAAELDGEELEVWSAIQDEEYQNAITTERDFSGPYDVFNGNLEVVDGSRGSLATRFAREQQADSLTCDVMVGELGAVTPQVDLQTLTAVPGYQATPDNMQATDSLVGYQLMPWGTSYNPERVNQVPEGYDDFLRDEFAGSEIGTDVSPPGAALIPTLETQGVEYLEQLGEQDISFVDSSFVGTQSLAQGEYKLFFGQFINFTLSFQEQDLPVEIVSNPDVWHMGAQILSSPDPANHPWAARLFIDYMTNPEHKEDVQAGRLGTMSADGTVANPQSVTDLYNPEEDQVWHSGTWGFEATTDLINEGIQALGAPVQEG